ncbi:acyltransferase family protein [Cryobacterium tagatosivorans]|uniref:Acyltransferase n=1 Tax=Cryobacterium tagatosivorans TaxID=1259199 RepID=A0A4R8UAP0_9MICO|nr:acyltransferase [Cryobacterium tagatosivorans]TFB47285.1 acyltransferase [Cryobacterium tagatosivorans]
MRKSRAGQATATAASRPALLPGPAGRDPVMDLARVFCLALVVVGHLFMLGASVTVGDDLVIERTLLLQPWLTPVTWVAQVMPLFFMIGGFVGVQAWRRTEARGGSAAGFIRGRFLRLARPAVPLFAFLSLGILVLHLTGVAPGSVAQIATGVASPLWFLAAYAFSQAYLPGMATLHSRAPRRTLVALGAAAVAVDIVSLTTELPVLGLFNMILVWLFLQQLGIWAADGWLQARSRLSLVLIVIAVYGALGLVTTLGPYPADMLENLNPPTVALIPLGVAQFAVLMLLHPLCRRLMRGGAVRLVVSAVGRRLMTVYLWHLPVLALVVGLLLLTPLPSPAPGSGAWWATRPVVLAVAVLALAGVSALLGRFERPVSASGQHAPASDWSIGASTALLIIPPFTVMVFGLDLVIAITGTALLTVAILLQRPRTLTPVRGVPPRSDVRAAPEDLLPPFDSQHAPTRPR